MHVAIAATGNPCVYETFLKTILKMKKSPVLLHRGFFDLHPILEADFFIFIAEQATVEEIAWWHSLVPTRLLLPLLALA